jgi:hypothetical protein
MNPEKLFARQLCCALDEGVRSLDPVIVERLRAARERALRHALTPVTAHEIVGAGGTARLGRHDSNGFHTLRSLLAMLALLLGVVVAYYWNGFNQAIENEEIDSALLAHDLPPNAYLDRGFQAWLEKDTSTGR